MNVEPERVGGLEVDHQIELGRLFDRQCAGFGAVKNSIHIRRGSPIEIGVARTITHEASRFRELLEEIHRRQPAAGGKIHDAFSLAEKNGSVRMTSARTDAVLIDANACSNVSSGETRTG